MTFTNTQIREMTVSLIFMANKAAGEAKANPNLSVMLDSLSDSATSLAQRLNGERPFDRVLSKTEAYLIDAALFENTENSDSNRTESIENLRYELAQIIKEG